MKKIVGATLGYGFVFLVAGCGDDSGGRSGARADGAADVGVAAEAGGAATILDPKGTYGGKTYAELSAEFEKWLFEYPGPGSPALNTPGAACDLGQSTAMGDGGAGADLPFFLLISDVRNIAGGTFTQACAVPTGRMIFLQLLSWCSLNVPGCSQQTEQTCEQYTTLNVTPLTDLALEIDGKPYGTKVADFSPYFTDCSPFSAASPIQADGLVSVLLGCPSTGSVVNITGYCAGYWILLAPLPPGPHTVHTLAKEDAYQAYPPFLYDVTYDITVGEPRPPIDAAVTPDLAPATSYCTGPASEALIDDMSGSNISLAPPSCGSPGGWTAWSRAPGVLTSPAGDASIVSDCGSLCQSLYSPLPVGFPGTMASVDADTVDSGIDDGGASGGMQAMCVAGQTSPKQYDWSGMTLTFAYSGTPTSGSGPVKVSSASGFTFDPPPALIDASQYSGIEFWLWASPETAAAMSTGYVVQLIDKNQLPGGGVCDPTATSGKKPCSVASAGVSFTAASASQGIGPLLGADGSELTSLAPGWQLVRAPWSSFLSNPYHGGGNEQSVDPATLAFAQFVIEQDSANGSAIPFDFCVYGLRFYK